MKTPLKLVQQDVTTLIATVRPLYRDETEAGKATRSRARLWGPQISDFFAYVVFKADTSMPQRVRAASLLAEMGGYVRASMLSEAPNLAPDETNGEAGE